MTLIDRQAREIPYDDEPVLRPDPDDPFHYTWTSADPPLLRVKLERGMRGGYSFAISYEATDPETVLTMLRQVNAQLLAEYGAER